MNIRTLNDTLRHTKVLSAMMFWAVLLLGFPAQAARIALVIGNSNYATMPDLPNPTNDATDVAAKLRLLGFKLVGDAPQVNLSAATMKLRIRELGQTAKAGDDVVFYYAGHGVGGDNDNFLVPVDDTEIKSRADVPDFAISARSVIARLEERGGGVNVLILDACRNNPLPGTRSADRGLARMAAPVGTFIAYAAGPGQTAADGSGRNGLFTAQLLRHMEEPGLRLDDLMSRVLDGVTTTTPGQEPVWESRLRRPFYFKPSAAAPAFDPSAAEKMPQQTVAQRPIPPAESTPCPDCPEMVVIPGGSFRMGDLSGNGSSNERPVHKVNIHSFSLSKAKVTIAQWRACEAARGCRVISADRRHQRESSHPITVSWDEAQEYIQWISKKTGSKYRLPSESEWEYAARAEKRFGLFSMLEHEQEWVQDCAADDYSDAPNNGDAWQASACDEYHRVRRGGGGSDRENHSRTAKRETSPTWFAPDNGFRLARTD